MSLPVSESYVEAHLVKSVVALGGICLKLKLDGQRGWPDRMVVWPCGAVHFVELKTRSGKLSKQQQAWHARLESLRQPCYVLWSVGEVQAYLDWCQEEELHRL
jgi:hypothetical protein